MVLNKMVICHCIAGPIAGGAENLVKDLSVKQVSLGSQVFVLFLNKALSVSRCEKYEQSFLSELTERGVKVIFADSKGIFGIYKLLKTIGKTYRVSTDRVIIHCHLLKSLLAATLLPKKYFKIIYTHHSINLKIPAFFYSILSRRVDGFIGISNACAKVLEASTGKSVEVIYNAVDPLKIKRRKPDLIVRPLKIIMVGSFRWEKNYETLVNALEEGKFSSDMLHIDVYGEGKSFGDIQSLINKKQLANLITLKGNSSNISQEYANYDLFLICSLSEGLPISLIEASVAGLPVAITDVGGCKEVVEMLGYGYVLPGTDSNMITKGLNNIIYSFNSINSHFSKDDNRIHELLIDYSANKHLDFYKGFK